MEKQTAGLIFDTLSCRYSIGGDIIFSPSYPLSFCCLKSDGGEIPSRLGSMQVDQDCWAPIFYARDGGSIFVAREKQKPSAMVCDYAATFSFILI